VTRIIAGQARGRRLAVPRSGTRPTSDRVREAMFASIESKLRTDGRTWSDVSVCDLWAGSGAVALEAWSRGATSVVAIDKAKVATEVIASNIRSVGASGVQVVRASVASAVQGSPPGGGFDVVFADPPYEVTDASITADLAAAHASGWFTGHAIVVVERAIRSPSPFPAFIEEVEQRPYGDTALWYGRVPEEQDVTGANSAVRST
jgi:16S rRNA (guanine966-N2)-methyltransferase